MTAPAAPEVVPRAGGFHTEATIIIHYSHRPLLIQGGDFEPHEDPGWRTTLEAASSQLLRALAGVGRLQSRDLDPQRYLGTAWLVGCDVAVTNRHITRVIAERRRRGELVVTLDLLGEAGSPAARELRVLDVLGEAEEHDLALLRIEPADASAVLKLAASARAGQRVAAIGYPSGGIGHYEPAEVERMFGGVFDVKRLSPGHVTGLSDARLDHDCTTLGGSSGSPLVELESGEVVGVHHGGAGRFLTNWAVPAGVVAELLGRLEHRRRSC